MPYKITIHPKISPIQFRAFKSHPVGYNKEMREIVQGYKEKYEKASSIASYPSTWLDCEISKEVAISICKRAMKLIDMGSFAYYKGKNSSHYGQFRCWSDTLAYLNKVGTEDFKSDWMAHGGVNNPFITERAKLI